MRLGILAFAQRAGCDVFGLVTCLLQDHRCNRKSVVKPVIHLWRGDLASSHHALRGQARPLLLHYIMNFMI